MKAIRSSVLVMASASAPTTRTLASSSLTPQRRPLHTTHAQDTSPPSSPTTEPSDRTGPSPSQSPHAGAHEQREGRMSFSSVSGPISHPASPATAGSKADEGSEGSSSPIVFDDADMVVELRPIFAERASRGEVKFGKERVEMRSLTTGTGAEWVW
ncbi:hypothetical protein ACRALDRAFT_2056867 [Sodiomyces alcalophilus JCM 7366]|uniref:uncharacterized protein n=1 Tax=Sodiomyces alcalophilus JCM 7366 TaxID=591952 RepID=UPI0039B50A9C